MKKNILYTSFLLIGFSLWGVSCSNGGDDDPIIPDSPVVDPDDPNLPTLPSYPTFESPNWVVSNVSSYEYTMTVSVVLPDSLRNSELSADKLSVFVGEECRGVADRVEISSGEYIWMVMVYGNGMSEDLLFKYYSSNTKYMYQSAVPKTFVIDGYIGTIDYPETLGMNIVTKKK